jgi:hypothetical protein
MPVFNIGNYETIYIHSYISPLAHPRVARWFIFKPKILIWGNFGGYCNGRCWYIVIVCSFGQSPGHLVYFMTIR